MDYQTFNSQQPAFGGFASQPQHSLPQAPLQQSTPSFAYGQFPNGQAFPSAGGMVGHGPGGGAPMNMMQPMQPGGMQRGERVTCAHTCRPIVSCCPPSPTLELLCLC
tara:strand:- start:12991 stop:13311 length:321 start_codon:yes stop_codon:yes gene_type:complete